MNNNTPFEQAHAPHNTRKTAFTLAEVLITLAIIGVVAALTIPSVVRNYQKTQTVTKLKKVYSTLSNTTNLAIADYGPIQTWEYYKYDVMLPNGDNGSTFFVKRYLLPYLKIAKDCGVKTDGECKFEYSFLNAPQSKRYFGVNIHGFYLSDGTFVNVQSYSTTNAPKYANIYFDLNGQNGPNVFGKDIFLIQYIIEHRYPSLSGKFIFYGQDRTRENLLGSGSSSCSKEATVEAGMTCGALIAKDGWQIKDDYPW